MPSVDPGDVSDSDLHINLSKTKKTRNTNRVTTDNDGDDPVDPVDTSDNLNHSLKTRKRKVTNRGDSESDDHPVDPVDTSDGGDNLYLSSKTRKRTVTNRVTSDSESDDNVPLSKLKKHKLDWEYEADMLAEFDKNCELCMEAVCALYRQQIEKEKSYDDGGPVIKGHGFNKYDAGRGMELAEFMTDGHPDGNVKKTVEELKEYNPYWTDRCLTLANRYSTQLFKIYKNEEDPFFCLNHLVHILNNNV